MQLVFSTRVYYSTCTQVWAMLPEELTYIFMEIFRSPLSSLDEEFPEQLDYSYGQSEFQEQCVGKNGSKRDVRLGGFYSRIFQIKGKASLSCKKKKTKTKKSLYCKITLMSFLFSGSDFQKLLLSVCFCYYTFLHYTSNIGLLLSYLKKKDIRRK